MLLTLTRKLLAVSCFLLTLVATGAPADDAPGNLTPKGIYHDVERYQRSGVKFSVDLLEQGLKPRRVSVNHGFRSGDRFTFRFEINRASHIYVVNQTLIESLVTTSGLHSKRIDRTYTHRRVRPSRFEAPAPPPPAPPPPTAPVSRLSFTGKPRLLFPTVEAGMGNRLRSRESHLVPNRGHYVMDDEAGTERLYVVLSESRIDLSGYFLSNGQIKSATAAERLRRKLEAWKQNAWVELTAKGIEHDDQVESYGVTIDPEQPAMIEIDLRHCRR